jgi:hypothetical protein
MHTYLNIFKKTKMVSICLLSSFVLSCAVLFGISSAGEFTVFGPQNYLRETGAPVVVSHNFSLTSTHPPYTLKVYNGGLQDNASIGEYVSSSEIRVNGVLLLGPQNFNQNVPYVEVPTDLQWDNVIDVEVRGKPGGVLTVSIVGVDDLSPL